MPQRVKDEMHAGGGMGVLTYLKMDKVCDRHVVLFNGDVLDSGFTVDKEGMCIQFSKAVPNYGQVVVLGFGRVLKARKIWSPFETIDNISEHFPTPRGLSYGYHPYNKMMATSATAFHKYRRNGYHWYGSWVAPGDDDEHISYGSSPHIYGRLSEYEIIQPYYYGRTLFNPQNPNARNLVRRTYGIHKVDLRTGSKTKLSKFEVDAPITYWDAGPESILNKYKPNQGQLGYWSAMVPDKAGNFYLMPMARNFHVWKLAAPDYTWFEDMGQATAPGGTNPAYGDNLYAFPEGNARQFGPGIRLFDGRFLMFPYPGVEANKNFYIFDPETVTMQVIEPAGLEQNGTSKWKQPVQAANGKVYALPTTFPGNTMLIFDPSDDSFTQHTMGMAYERADMQHTTGVPMADGRIMYCHTYGAVTDINKFLMVDTNDNTSIGSRAELDLDLDPAILTRFCRAFALSDGNIMFLGSPGDYEHNGKYRGTYKNTPDVYVKYDAMVYNWAKDDYRLYKIPFLREAYVPYGDYNDYYYTLPYDFAMDLSLFMPFYADVAARMTIYEQAYDTIYMNFYHEAPMLKDPGTFVRQAYFGRMT